METFLKRFKINSIQLLNFDGPVILLTPIQPSRPFEFSHIAANRILNYDVEAGLG